MQGEAVSGDVEPVVTYPEDLADRINEGSCTK